MNSSLAVLNARPSGSESCPGPLPATPNAERKPAAVVQLCTRSLPVSAMNSWPPELNEIPPGYSNCPIWVP
jgi:hypothetical protein